jgi:hypothetical protein
MHVQLKTAFQKRRSCFSKSAFSHFLLSFWWRFDFFTNVGKGFSVRKNAAPTKILKQNEPEKRTRFLADSPWFGARTEFG